MFLTFREPGGSTSLLVFGRRLKRIFGTLFMPYFGLLNNSSKTAAACCFGLPFFFFGGGVGQSSLPRTLARGRRPPIAAALHRNRKLRLRRASRAGVGRGLFCLERETDLLRLLQKLVTCNGTPVQNMQRRVLVRAPREIEGERL